VRVPSVAEEDARHLHRSRETIQQDRTRLINRVKSLLLTQGVVLMVDASFPTALHTARVWDGTPIPAGLKARLDRAWAHLTFLNDELDQLDTERDAIAWILRRRSAAMSTRCRPCAGLARSARGRWPRNSLRGGRSRIGDSSAAWWGWCQHRIKAARAIAIKASRAPGIGMSAG
jgi:transposase